MPIPSPESPASPIPTSLPSRMAPLSRLDSTIPRQMQIVCHRLCHARGIVHLNEFLVALKKQEDETGHREVINDDGIYDIRVMDVLTKQVLAAMTEF